MSYLKTNDLSISISAGSDAAAAAWAAAESPP